MDYGGGKEYVAPPTQIIEPPSLPTPLSLPTPMLSYFVSYACKGRSELSYLALRRCHPMGKRGTIIDSSTLN